ASALIAHNRSRHGKTLWTEDEAGDRIRIASLWDDQEEARFVGEEIEAYQRDRVNLNDIAVLVRTGFQTRAFEERFINLGLPYRMIGGPRFYERAEIRDAIAYLRVVAQPDDDMALERIINRPKRGLGEATMQLLRRHARGSASSLSVSARSLCGTDELRPKVRTTIGRLLDDFERWREQSDRLPPRTVAETVLEESGYVQMWQDDRSVEAPGRLENLKELVQALDEFETLAGFLEHVGLVMENASDPDGDKVTIMTLHSAKGLEFGHIFLPGWEEGLFPNQRAIEEGGTKALEEERRLAYVGITRAKRALTICYAANRRIYNQWAASVPARFVEELPAEHTEFLQRQSVPEPAMSGWFDDLRAGGRGPGFHRMRAAGKATVIEGQARVLATETPKSKHTLVVGQRIFHDKFGYGEVRRVEGNKLEIAFDKAGTKKVIDSFVTPA
ncbi:MAG: 3'-5' exonuclease, partial [Pseudomonadota bacterium]